MATNYFWQGGKRVEVEQASAAVTVQAASVAAAAGAAAAAGVAVQQLAAVRPGLVRATVEGKRDESMAALRDEAVVHHVYHTPDHPAGEYLITDSFYVKFKKGTSDASVRDFLR